MVDTWETRRDIDEVKIITDFAGNEYVLVETSPKGYLIYNYDTKIIIEYSDCSESPYKSVKTGLYFGPTEYYYFNHKDEKYHHTITEESINETQYEKLSEECANVQREFEAYSRSSDCDLDSVLISNDTSLADRGVTYIGNHRNFFENLDTHDKMGYYTTPTGAGLCGYVASGIVLLYFNKYLRPGQYINNSYVNSTKTEFVGYGFTRHLYYDIGVNLLGYSNAINAQKAAKVMKKYLKHDKDITVTTWSLSSPTVSNIIHTLSNSIVPVIFVNKFYKPDGSGTVNHDVVVYGYSTNNKLHAHYGWANQTNVTLTWPASTFISSACAITYY